MPVFQYTARTLKGDLQSGEVDLPTRDDVIAHLRKNRMVVVQVRAAPKAFKLSFKFGGGIKTRDLVVMTRQFATMINAGLPLVQALDILAKQTENQSLAEITRSVVYDVESGHTLADALRKHPKAFGDLYVNMVAAGEAGGILDTILVRLSEFLEKNDAIIRKVKGAMIYPAVIMSVAAIAIAVLLIFVIPTFQNMFASVNLELPLPTRIVIGMSSILTHYWWVIIGATGGFVFLLSRWYKTAPGRLQIDKLLLRLPVLGDVIRKSAVSRFTRTLGTLISSGVSILDGLEITARTAGNMVIHNAVMESRASIAGGETIAGPLQKSNVFPPMVISMIAVGEQTGGLDEMLSKIADFYDDEVDVAVSARLSVRELIMIVVPVVIVGGMVVAMYLPIFDMVNAVQCRRARGSSAVPPPRRPCRLRRRRFARTCRTRGRRFRAASLPAGRRPATRRRTGRRPTLRRGGTAAGQTGRSASCPSRKQGACRALLAGCRGLRRRCRNPAADGDFARCKRRRCDGRHTRRVRVGRAPLLSDTKREDSMSPDEHRVAWYRWDELPQEKVSEHLS